MDTHHTTHGPEAARHAGPMVARRLLGGRLRRLREARGISREDAGDAIRGSHCKISRLELGRTGFKPRDVTDLLTLYGVGDEAERNALLALTEQANTPGWLHTYSDVLTSSEGPRLELEQAAAVIRTYAVQFVPSLLQTADYSRASIRVDHPGAPASEVERRSRLLMERQRFLHRTEPVRLWAVLDEASLRRQVGSAGTMLRQFDHLLAMAELPHVTLQVMPFSTGVAAGGPVTLLRFTEPELADVVFLEQLTDAICPVRSADIVHYMQVMDRLAVRAAPVTATTALLRRIREEFAASERA